MKKLLLLLTLFISTSTYAQKYSNLENIDLIELKDYDDNEDQVLECADYILSKKIGESELNKLYCTQFIMRWMEGCAMTFELGSDFLELPGKDLDLGQVYMACLAKAGIENKDKSEDTDFINGIARNLFLDYCENDDNKVKKNKKLKKALSNRTA